MTRNNRTKSGRRKPYSTREQSWYNPDPPAPKYFDPSRTTQFVGNSIGREAKNMFNKPHFTDEQKQAINNHVNKNFKNPYDTIKAQTNPYSNPKGSVESSVSPSESSGGNGGYSSSSSTSYIRNELPAPDFSIFDKLERDLRANAENSKGVVKSSYDTLMESIKQNRLRNSQKFGQGRGLVVEDAFTRSRDLANSLANRGLAGSGLQQLGDIQEKMETGQNVSRLAQQFYDDMARLDNEEKRGANAYQANVANIDNSLRNQLSALAQQRFNYQRQYEEAMRQNEIRNQMMSQGRGGYGGGVSVPSVDYSAVANLIGMGYSPQTISMMTGTDVDTLTPFINSYNNDMDNAKARALEEQNKQGLNYYNMLRRANPNASNEDLMIALSNSGYSYGDLENYIKQNNPQMFNNTGFNALGNIANMALNDMENKKYQVRKHNSTVPKGRGGVR